jgi:hypothetical protein
MVEILLTGAVRSPSLLEEMALMDGRESQKRTTCVYGLEKSDDPIVLRKRPNNQQWAEAVEGRGSREETWKVLTLRIRRDAQAPRKRWERLRCQAGSNMYVKPR